MTSKEGKQYLSRTFDKVDEGGKVTHYGEINGLCFTQFEDLVEEVEKNMNQVLD